MAAPMPNVDNEGESLWKVRMAWSMSSATPKQFAFRFLEAIDRGEFDIVAFLFDKVDLAIIDPITGLNALHFAAGRDNIDLVRDLIEAGVAMIPDGSGRMPSIIAIECGACDEIIDLLCNSEPS